jgi:glutathione synthase/RimK-type ligase-like ATP-grasp enzyme
MDRLKKSKTFKKGASFDKRGQRTLKSLQKEKGKKRSFFLTLFSRHPSHNVLRKALIVPKRTLIRLGSTTKGSANYTLEINSIQSVKNSANKLLMKKIFKENDIKTADWWTEGTLIDWAKERYPIVAKSIYGSRGRGNTLIKNEEDLYIWAEDKNLSNYIFEKYYSYNREYRLHVTKNGCFYACRKVLKSETPEDKRWFRNDSNCSWLLETNEKFDKPVNWEDIEKECVKALTCLGLDIGGFDVRVQSSKDKDGNLREYPEFIVIESNSACSFGDITGIKYKEAIEKLIKEYYDC